MSKPLISSLDAVRRYTSMWKLCFLLCFLFLVDGVLGDKVTVHVTKGEVVTLNSSTEVQRNDQILWKFRGSIIVKVEEALGIYNTSIDGRFRDRLKMDNKTGSLTITSVTSEDAGIYQLDINNDDKATEPKQFDVIVYEEESVSVTEGNSVTLQTGVTDIQRDDLIVWKFKDEVIPFPSLNDRDGRWSNVHLNGSTGELEFRRIQRTQSGLYEVEINTSRFILHRKFSVHVGSRLSSATVALIVVCVLLVLLLVCVVVTAAVGVICYPHEIIELIRRIHVEKKETNDPLNAETANSGAS